MHHIKSITATFVNGSARTFKVVGGRLIHGLAFEDKETIWFPSMKLNPFYNDLSCVFDLKNRGFGYMNRRGEMVVPAKYLTGSDFSEKRAFVFDGEVLFLLNEQCEIIKEFNGSLVTMDIFQDGISRVSVINAGLSDLRIDGFINRTGEIVLPIQFPFPITTPSFFDRNDLYSEGLLRVWRNGNFGFMNIEGKMIIPHTYNEASCFQNGRAMVSQGELYGFINKNNETIIPYQYESARGFSEGLAAVKTDGLWGYIDVHGTIVIPPIFTSVGYFKNNTAPIRTQERAGLIDEKGNFIITPGYDSIEVFEEGICRIVKGGKEGLMDTHGNEILADQTALQEFSENN